MDISSFKAGKLTQRYQCKSFEPNLVDIPWRIDQPEINMLLSQANFKPGQLNAF